jgi:hypothetical protein
MVGTLQPHCLSHQKPKASSRQQHESAKKENPKSLPTLHGLESRAKIFAPSSRRGSFSLDSPLYRTPLPYMWRVVPFASLLHYLSEDYVSTIDVLILVPLIPLAPVLITWWLPWERWLFKKVPQKILGPYLLYAAFAAWRFKWESWIVFLIGAIGVVCCVVALVKKYAN